MKTTIDLPPQILERAKILATRKKSTLKDLVIAGLDHVLSLETEQTGNEAALNRIRQGFHLGNKPFSREEAHARR
jgi:hypothetical protein